MHRSPFHQLLIPISLLCLASPARALQVPDSQPSTAPTSKKPLTLETLYGKDRVNFSGSYVRGLQWLPDGHFYLQRIKGVLHRVDPETNDRLPLYDVDALQTALTAHPAFTPETARKLARQPLSHTPSWSAVLIEHANHLYFYDFAAGHLQPLTTEPRPRRHVSLSPLGNAVAFVADNNLFTIDTRSTTLTQITHDGAPDIYNAALDWVYMEELYGRGNRRGYWWSEDGRYLAFLRLDDRQVPRFELVNQIPLHADLEVTNYPKPGDPNPLVALALLEVGDNEVQWLDLSAYEHQDILIVNVAWHPTDQLFVTVQDREQTWLDLLLVSAPDLAARRLFREHAPAWVEFCAPPFPLPDSEEFLWLSARDGFRHLYRYDLAGRLLQRLTRGPWDVHQLSAVSKDTDFVYFTATRDTFWRHHLYRLSLSRSAAAPERLTNTGFHHNPNVAPAGRYFLDTYSNHQVPPKVALHHADGRLLRMLSENPVDKLADFQLAEVRFLDVPTRDGYVNRGILFLPPADLRPPGPLPVWCMVYGGPLASITRDRWGGTRSLFRHLLACEGRAVWVFDPRSASYQGVVSGWQAYQRLGALELRDLEDSLQYLIAEGLADPARIGIEGGSYGGFFTAYALTHSDRFAAGIAGSSVTDWRLYDSIYTERYMRTPDHNPDGYAASSAVAAAENLVGRLLITHGLMDDNVHFQNSLRLIDALQSAGREFDVMIYPHDRHGIWRGREFHRDYKLRFIRHHIGPQPAER